jgi:hypothetical protein
LPYAILFPTTEQQKMREWASGQLPGGIMIL